MADQEKGKQPAEKKQAEKPAKVKKPSLFARMGKWFRELKSEIHKIVWPTAQQTLNNTVVVIAAIFIIGVFIWVLDAVLGFGVRNFINHLA